MAPKRMSVRSLRVNAGMTQKQVADKLGVAVSTYSIWERSPGRMTVDRVQRLMAVLGIEDVNTVEIGFRDASQIAL